MANVISERLKNILHVHDITLKWEMSIQFFQISKHQL